VGLKSAINEYVDIPNPNGKVPELYTSRISFFAPRNDKSCAWKGPLLSSDIERILGHQTSWTHLFSTGLVQALDDRFRTDICMAYHQASLRDVTTFFP